MGQVYQHLLSIVFKHLYFKDDQFKSLQISFDQESSRLLKNLGIILKSFPGGAHFLTSDSELLNNTGSTLPIRLFLDCNDPYYINYTELNDYRPADTVLYFNNIDLISNSKSSQLQLQSEEHVGQNEVIPLSFGKIVPTKFNSDKHYHFKDVFGNDISNEDIRQSPNDPPHFTILNGVQGLLRVFADGQEEERVYYYPSPVWKKPLGIIEIYTGILFEQFNTNKKQEYVLNFDTRRTIWKYFLLGPVYKKFTDLSIIDSNKKKVFKPPEKQTVQEVETLVFESENEISLSEFSDDGFQLVDKFRSDRKINPIVIKSLPRASPEQLHRDNPTSRKTYYSHIYI